MNKLNILWSVDVEDYFMSPESIPESTWETGQYEDRIAIGCQKLLHLFQQSGVRATWFFLGWVADRHPELVRNVFEAGHEVAAHTWDHRGVNTLSPGQYKDSLDQCCHLLEKITGEKVVGHRAPMWSIRREMDWAIRILEEAGFLYDSSINPVATYLYGERGAPRLPYRIGNQGSLLEIPPSAIRMLGNNWSVGGGFFFRAFPTAYMKWAICRFNRSGVPAVVYLHPWELDPEHPIPRMSWKETRIHCFGLRSTEKKLKDLMENCTSMTMKNYAVQWLESHKEGDGTHMLSD